MLQVKNVNVIYKKKYGIKDASFIANEKEIVGFIGADGSGKSSLMHAISGIKRFDGEIVFDNFSYHSVKETEKIKQFIGFMPQGIGLVLYPDLTVDEHLDFFSDIRGIKRDSGYFEYRERLLHMAGLSEFRDRLAKNLSGGMMQKLSLICTLIHNPKLLILDEPTTGVDPLSRKELWEILQDNKKKGNISIISTAYMQEAQKMDKILLFDEGEIIAKGSANELIESARAFTYELTDCKDSECISFFKSSYSLKPLNSPHKTPTLDALFFINALKKRKIPPKIEILPREEKIEIPPIVMEAKALTKKFGNFIANDNIDMILKSGEILGLLGANGAGKTTFIKMLLGLYPIDSGELFLLGKKIASYKDRQKLKSKIGYMSQHFALYKDLTVRENLLYFANLHQIPITKALSRIKKLSLSLGFDRYLDYFPKDLPLGINQRFSLAIAILHEPIVVFLDEPTSGVDTIARAQFWQLLHELKEKWNISILITTHYMSEAEYCDRVVLLKRGSKIADDKVENLYKKFPEAENFEEIFLRLYKGQR